jgi:hypothetical protein
MAAEDLAPVACGRCAFYDGTRGQCRGPRVFPSETSGTGAFGSSRGPGRTGRRRYARRSRHSTRTGHRDALAPVSRRISSVPASQRHAGGPGRYQLPYAPSTAHSGSRPEAERMTSSTRSSTPIADSIVFADWSRFVTLPM